MTIEANDDLCWKIITAVAEERNVERDMIEDRLHDVISVDALQQLADQSGESGAIELSVSFRLANCFVTVTDGGRVRASCPGESETTGLVTL